MKTIVMLLAAVFLLSGSVGAEREPYRIEIAEDCVFTVTLPENWHELPQNAYADDAVCFAAEDDHGRHMEVSSVWTMDGRWSEELLTDDFSPTMQEINGEPFVRYEDEWRSCTVLVHVCGSAVTEFAFGPSPDAEFDAEKEQILGSLVRIR